MLLIRTKLTLFIFVMLMFFFLFQVASRGGSFFVKEWSWGVLNMVIYFSFLNSLVTNDYFVYRPSLKDSVDWFILMTNFVFGLVYSKCALVSCSFLFYRLFLFLLPSSDADHIPGNGMFIFTTSLSWIDDSFAWCIRYTRRLCNKNMKSLALTE